jgi:hypothetical protein
MTLTEVREERKTSLRQQRTWGLEPHNYKMSITITIQKSNKVFKAPLTGDVTSVISQCLCTK